MSARITSLHYAKLLLEWSTLPQEQQQKYIRELARDLASRHHTAWLPKIITAYDTLQRKQAGITDATLFVPFALQDSDLQTLTKQFSRVTGKTLALRMQVDPSLLTGFRLRVGSDLYDTSGSQQLKRLETVLAKAPTT